MKRGWVVLPVLAVTIVSLPLLAEEKKPEKKKPNFVAQALSGVTLGKGQRVEQMILFPLVAKSSPAEIGLVPDLRSNDVAYREPEWPERPYNLSLSNGGDRPVLLLGGGVLLGGYLDRLVPRDAVLPGHKAIELETLPAAYPKERRKKPVFFQHANSFAPSYLRERAVFDPTRYLVPIFISHFLDFRDPGDDRHSLEAIDESAALGSYCQVCQQAVSHFPDIADARVVGFIVAVRGRILTLELFGTNGLLRTYFHRIVRGYTYDAAAIHLRAKKVGMPIPDDKDPKHAVEKARKSAEKLLAEIADARYRPADLPPGTIGDTLLLRKGGTQGTAIALSGRLVHAVVFAANPFEEALYSRPIQPPPDKYSGEESFGELSRREARGHLSEFEKRLLDRMRERRQR